MGQHGWVDGSLDSQVLQGMLLGDGIDNIGANGFIAFWLLAWTVGGLAITFILLWGYFGKESLIEDRNQILFEKTVFGIGKKNRLDKKGNKKF